MKKTLDLLKNIFTTLVFLLAVAMMIFTIVSVNTFDRNDRALLGYKAFIVLSDSMSATDFDAGDLVLVKEVDPATLQPGDIIAFESVNDSNYGQTVTHKIRSLTTDHNGNPGFITYGTTTGIDDDAIVTYPYVRGQYQFALPKVGAFFQFLKTTPGYIVCILLPFLVLILMQGVNTIQLFRQYKREQMEELEAERARLAQEREDSQRMMAELLALRQQLSQTAPAAPPPVPEAPPADAPESPSAE